MLKKIVCGIIVGILLYSGLCVNAQLVPITTNQEEEAVCYATYMRSTSEKVSISAKNATVRCSFTGYAATTKVSITAYLQKKSGTSWSGITSWSQTFNASSGTLSKSKTVTAGTYRIMVVYTAYSGSKSEVTTKYSSSTVC